MLQLLIEDLGFEMELVQASRHGRERSRKERRCSSDDAVSLIRADGARMSGWALDRSESGARMIILGEDSLVAGEVVSLAFPDEPHLVTRIAWARPEREAVVIGVELVITA